MPPVLRLPLDTIKIDRSFVPRIENNSVSEAIVHAVVAMAKAPDVTVVAEGVETEFEMEVVRKARCHAAQGYHLCKPLSAQELAVALEAVGREGRFDSRSSNNTAAEDGPNGLVPGLSRVRRWRVRATPSGWNILPGFPP